MYKDFFVGHKNQAKMSKKINEEKESSGTSWGTILLGTAGAIIGGALIGGVAHAAYSELKKEAEYKNDKCVICDKEINILN